MKKIFILPMVWLILGAVSIAAEIKIANSIPPGQMLSGVVIDCIRNALETRETLVFSAFTSYQTEASIVLSARKVSLLLAFNAATKSEIKSAVSATWKTYKSNMSALKAALSASRRTAWSTYKTQIKACKWTSLVQNIDFSTVNNEQ